MSKVYLDSSVEPTGCEFSLHRLSSEDIDILYTSLTEQLSKLQLGDKNRLPISNILKALSEAI